MFLCDHVEDAVHKFGSYIFANKKNWFLGKDLACKIHLGPPVALVKVRSNSAVVLTVVVDLLLMFIVTLFLLSVGGFMVGPHFVMQYLVSFLVLQSSC